LFLTTVYIYLVAMYTKVTIGMHRSMNTVDYRSLATERKTSIAHVICFKLILYLGAAF